VSCSSGALERWKSRGLRSVTSSAVSATREQGPIWRRTYPSSSETNSPAFCEHPQLRQYFNEQKRLLKLPNGSTEEFCYSENEKGLVKVGC